MLVVHFGDNAPDVIDKSHIKSSFTPNSSSILTASIYLHLTEGTSLYGYRFSVRYDDDLLSFIRREQSRPDLSADGGPVFEPDAVVENEIDDVLGIPKSDPDPVDPSFIGSPIANAKDLYRFNGIIKTLDNLTDDGFYKVASLTFSIKTPSTPLPSQRTLVIPGKFDVKPKDPPLFPDEIVRDAILTDDVDSNGVPLTLNFTPSGGGTSNSTVPEPTSALVVGLLGMLTFVKRKCLMTASKR